MPHPLLFKPLQLGSITLPNRIIMAPLTRMRAGTGNVPTALNAKYYEQRATAGLIVAEGTAVSQQGQGYPNAPGIYTQGQIDGWKAVTRAVHSKGGRIFLQIAHNGRNSHSSFIPDGGPPVAPSAIPPALPGFTSDGRQVSIETPRPLRLEEISPNRRQLYSSQPPSDSGRLRRSRAASLQQPLDRSVSGRRFKHPVGYLRGLHRQSDAVPS